MADAKADIEKIIKVHFYHGYPENLTIKDNPDAPDIGFEIIHEVDNIKTVVNLWKEDAEQIINALKLFLDIKEENV